MHRILAIRSIALHSICVFSILAAIPAAAASFILVSANRFVLEQGTSFCGSCEPPSEFSTSSSEQTNEFGLFTELVSGVGGEAEQSSSLLSNKFMGNGRVDTGFTSSNSATSFFRSCSR